MSDVNKLVADSVEEINRENKANCEREVRKLVQSILAKQGEIKSLTVEIAEAKEKLRKLQLPEAVAVEL